MGLITHYSAEHLCKYPRYAPLQVKLQWQKQLAKNDRYLHVIVLLHLVRQFQK